MKHIDPATLSRPTGYTHVVEAKAGRTLYISGQVALDAAGALVGEGDLAAQTQQVFENLKSALAAGAATLDHVAKITVFITDASRIATFREIRNRYFTQALPASTLVQVVALARPEWLIEVEAIAIVEA